MPHILLEFALIFIMNGGKVDPVSVHIIIQPIALVPLSIMPPTFSFTMSQRVGHLSMISIMITIFIGIVSLMKQHSPVGFSSLPITNYLRIVWVYKESKSLGLVIEPISNIYGIIVLYHNSASISLVSLPLTKILSFIILVFYLERIHTILDSFATSITSSISIT